MQRLTISGNACTETLAMLIAVAWADGRLDESEKAGVRGAVQVLNLNKELRSRIDGILAKPVRVDHLLLEPLSGRERAFAFVASAWMARIDGTVDPKEQQLLDEIGKALGHSKERQSELAAIAAKLEPLPEGVRSWSKEITRLFKAIPPELEEPGGEFEVAFE